MAPGSSKDANRSSSSKKDSKHKDKDNDSRYRTTGDLSSKSSRKPVAEEDEPAKSSSRNMGSILKSAFFKDESRPPTPKTTSSHRIKDSHSKITSTSHEHHKSNKTTNEERYSKPSLKVEARPDKVSKKEKLQPSRLFKTAFTNPKDIEMAEKQTRLKTLKPEEVEKQHRWAQEKLKNHGACPAGFKWWDYNKGVDEAGKHLEGYRCWMGNHLVSHQLLAEGKGGYYMKIRPTLLADLQATQGGYGSPVTMGGFNRIPQYPSGYNAMMPGFQTPGGYSPFQQYPGMVMAQMPQLAPQIQPSNDPNRSAPPGFITWYGPEYPTPESIASAAHMKNTNIPGFISAKAAGNILGTIQQNPPRWMTEGN